jgi:hypothetical protein
MKVLNIHERELEADAARIGALIDSLASKEDRLGPKYVWPRMEFDRPLGGGANGRHGPIRYFVEAFTPAESITFRFTGPKGFDGFHGLEIVSGPNQRVVLRHTLSMTTHGPAVVSWPLVFRPMHDALVEELVNRYKGTETHVACVAHGGVYWMMLPVVLKNVTPELIARHGFEYTACIVAEWRPTGLFCVEWNGHPVEAPPSSA